MQVGDLVKHNGSGPVGWKMKGFIGVIIKREKRWTTGGEWRVLWSTPVSEWSRDVLWFRSELEVISENR